MAAEDRTTVIAPGNIRVRGARAAVLTGDLVARIERMFQRMAGKGPSPVVFEAGRTMGMQLAGGALEPSLAEAASFLADTNLGRLVVVSLDDAGRGGILRVEGSFFALAYAENAGRSSRPVCDYLRGLLAGVFERCLGGRFLCLERRCAARGEDACEFSVYRAGSP